MPRSEEEFEAVDLLYRAAMEPELWPEALEKLAHAAGCVGTALLPVTPNDTTGMIVSPLLGAGEAEYKKEWYRYDTRLQRKFARRLSRGVVCEAQLFSEEEVARDPMRQEYLAAYGVGAFAAQMVEPRPGEVFTFSLQRALNRGHFEGTEIETLNRLGRHAARAFTISRRLAACEGITAGLFEVLDRFDGGVFVLNANHEVALMNGTAERLLGDGLAVIRRRLFASAPDRQQVLDLLISSAFDRESAEFGQVALARPSGRKPLLAQIMPLASRRALDDVEKFAFTPEGALLLVVDPDQAGVEPHEGLRLLGLTAAEARLAALVGTGVRRRDAAAILGISEWTARDTLKHVYSKLDITTQGELVRLVDRIGAVEPKPNGHG